MSLEQLINNVSIDLKIKEEAALNILELFIETAGIQSFSLRIFEEELINAVKQKVILKRLEENGFLEKEISYECYVANDEGVTNDLNNECEFCGESISVNIDHEIEYIYKLVNDVIGKFRNYKQQFEFNKYIIMDYRKNLDSLVENKEDIIPFIGAGLSIPFGLPSWGGLLEKLEDNLTKSSHIEVYKEFIEDGDYLEALGFLMSKSQYISTDDQLRREVVKIIESDIKPVEIVHNHSYSDLLKLKSNFYITTNYDLCISDFISRDENKYAYPLTIEEIIDTQELLKGENQVIHLHGHIRKRDTMIVSKKNYDNLYNNPAVRTLLSTIVGARPLFFVGWSFNDEFFNELYNDLNAILRTSHYIVLVNPDHHEVRKFSEKDIKVIGINVKLSSNGRIDSVDFTKAFSTLVEYILSK